MIYIDRQMQINIINDAEEHMNYYIGSVEIYRNDFDSSLMIIIVINYQISCKHKIADQYFNNKWLVDKKLTEFIAMITIKIL